jgi:glutaminase
VTSPGAGDGSRFPFDPIGGLLGRIRDEFAGDDDGVVADYIPQLATADPTDFGLALVGVAGSLYEAGQSDVPFTIQSVSKPFVYALALADVGTEEVLARVGVEPSGEGFNAISLEPGTGRPDNPLINAGAILTTSLVAGSDPAERSARVLDLLSRCAGRSLTVDEAVYRSEHDTGDRNRALAHLMRAAGSLTIPVEDAVDVYFRQCSVLVTAADLAVMAATLANGGVNPRTGDRVMDQLVAERVLTVMATCGMYDFSGEWLFRVGLPAKSGVAGGLVAVSPSQFGIGLYSPRLDERGNSVRGVAASRAISERFSLHLMHQSARSGPAFVRVAADGVEMPIGAPFLAGEDVRVLALQGYIEFATAELALLALRTHVDDEVVPTGVVIDLDHVTSCQPVAVVLLDAIIDEAVRRGLGVVTVDRRARTLLHAPAEFPTRAGAAAFLRGEGSDRVAVPGRQSGGGPFRTS